MQEAEQLVTPLEKVFNRISVKNLRNDGVSGAIPIELSKKDLVNIAESKGYRIIDMDLDGYGPGVENGFIVVNSDDISVPLYTKRGYHGTSVYVLDDEFEAFKKLFFGE